MTTTFDGIGFKEHLSAHFDYQKEYGIIVSKYLPNLMIPLKFSLVTFSSVDIFCTIPEQYVIFKVY